MKKFYCCIIILFCFAYQAHTQLEYALIEHEILYVNNSSSQGKDYMLSSSLKDSIISETDISTRSHYSAHFKWHKKENQIITTTIYGFSRTRSDVQVSCELTPIELLDSSVTRKNTLIAFDSLTLIYGDKYKAINFYLMQKRLHKTTFRIQPVLDWLRPIQSSSKANWFQNILWPTDLDVTYHRDSLFFLHRKARSIELWYKNYTTDNKENYSNFDWISLKAYSVDSTDLFLKYVVEEKDIRLRVTKNYNYSSNSIPDTSIFKGSLKLIMQDDNVFIFNLTDGKIYKMGYNIKLVGALQNIQNPSLNFHNKPLLVEDKDQGIVWTSQEIVKYADNKDFPRMQPLQKGQLAAYFEKY